jgi:hypothetical protein
MPDNKSYLVKICAGVALALVSSAALAKHVKVKLAGDQETPPVTTSATGAGIITVNPDKTVKGSVMTTGIEGIAAHIHQGAAGQEGEPIITLTQGANGKWSVPAGAKLSDDQYAAYKAGNLYVNVHSAAHQGGEIRAQLKP